MNARLIDKVNRIDKDHINSLPIIKFKGRIDLIDNQKKLERAVKRLLKEKELGFDTESRPSFKPGVSFPISLIQLASIKEAYLFQLNKLLDCSRIFSVLASNEIKKIGIDTEGDLKKLKDSFNFEPNNFIDLGKIAEQKGIIQFGARNLSARYLNQRISKACQTSNWSRGDLTRKQLEYAATDAWICLKIYPLLTQDGTDYNCIE